jgi:cobalt-zinc-cadmium efflux system outer membrane protein
VNTARLELGRAIRERTLAEQRHAAATAEFRFLLGLAAGERVELVGDLQIPEQLELTDGPAVLEAALAARQELVAARHDLLAAEAEQRVARRELIPTPVLGASYERESDERIVQGTLSFELPVFDRSQAARGVASARAGQAERLLRALELRIREEAQLAAIRHAAAHVAAQAYAYAGGVAEAMHQNLAMVDEGYRAGKIDFFQLVVIRRETLDARRSYIEALEELNSAEAELARVIGRSP